MSGLTIKNTRLIAGIEEIAAYFGKDSDEVMQDLVDTELKHIAPAMKAKRKWEEARQAAEQTKRQYEKLIKQPVSENLPKISSPEKLKGTKPVEGYFDGIEVKMADWNKVLEQVLKILCKKIGIKSWDLAALLKEFTGKTITQSIQGYQPIEELDISLPSLSVPNIARTIQKIAEKYDISFSFKVRYNKPKFGDTEKYWLFTNA
ncbi:hypothetical protein [Candidatus Tokpelaia sp.]|uniref:hypothetical protein n=1 Tax=Candidatus Tokpelaia sp. TaxID=2233777 RepID=UPI00123BE658|nr:hypothetical protein [Candidatus Tokpelaia sp.]KAA6404924.1 hypothetical protein DPQ22_08545 [Candidatus Tokpelaia sp.]